MVVLLKGSTPEVLHHDLAALNSPSDFAQLERSFSSDRGLPFPSGAIKLALEFSAQKSRFFKTRAGRRREAVGGATLYSGLDSSAETLGESFVVYFLMHCVPNIAVLLKTVRSPQRSRNPVPNLFLSENQKL